MRGKTSTAIWRPCERCGTTFRTWPRNIAAGNGRFCTQACFGADLSAKAAAEREPLAVRLRRKTDRNGPVPPHRPELGPCWLFTERQNGGYGGIDDGSGNRRMIRAHRASWIVEVGPIPVGLCVLHRCDNPACVRPSHLFLGTMKDNTADMVAKGRGGTPPMHVGAAHHKAKVDDDTVRAIRQRVAAGERQTTVARDFRLSTNIVNRIIRGRTWKHLP